MNLNNHDDMWAAVGKVTAYVAALLGSITLAQVQAVVGICSTVLVGSVAAVNLYLLWRDKVRTPPKE